VAPHPRNPSSFLLAGRTKKLYTGPCKRNLEEAYRNSVSAAGTKCRHERLENQCFSFHLPWGDGRDDVVICDALLWGAARFGGVARSASTFGENGAQKGFV